MANKIPQSYKNITPQLRYDRLKEITISCSHAVIYKTVTLLVEISSMTLAIIFTIHKDYMAKCNLPQLILPSRATTSEVRNQNHQFGDWGFQTSSVFPSRVHIVFNTEDWVVILQNQVYRMRKYHRDLGSFWFSGSLKQTRGFYLAITEYEIKVKRHFRILYASTDFF